jgi:hypothetical protein
MSTTNAPIKCSSRSRGQRRRITPPGKLLVAVARFSPWILRAFSSRATVYNARANR